MRNPMVPMLMAVGSHSILKGWPLTATVLKFGLGGEVKPLKALVRSIHWQETAATRRVCSNERIGTPCVVIMDWGAGVRCEGGVEGVGDVEFKFVTEIS